MRLAVVCGTRTLNIPIGTLCIPKNLRGGATCSALFFCMQQSSKHAFLSMHNYSNKFIIIQQNFALLFNAQYLHSTCIIYRIYTNNFSKNSKTLLTPRKISQTQQKHITYQTIHPKCIKISKIYKIVFNKIQFHPTLSHAKINPPNASHTPHSTKNKITQKPHAIYFKIIKKTKKEVG